MLPDILPNKELIASLKNGGVIPDFISFDASAAMFEIRTSDLSKAGLYELMITVVFTDKPEWPTLTQNIELIVTGSGFTFVIEEEDEEEANQQQ